MREPARMPRVNDFSAPALCCVAALMIGGCGNKGPLYLPESGPESAQAGPAKEQPGSADQAETIHVE